jgi:hypothetical protein
MVMEVHESFVSSFVPSPTYAYAGVGLVIHSSTEADVFRTGTGLCVIHMHMHTQPEVIWHTSVLRNADL